MSDSMTDDEYAAMIAAGRIPTVNPAGEPWVTVFTTATAKRSLQEVDAVVPAAPEVLPEETP